MPFRLSPEVVERARLQIQAASVLAESSSAIAQACADASQGEIIIAGVRPDLEFGGVFVVPLHRLREQVISGEAGSWVLVFSPGTPLWEIEARCRQMGKYAEARYKLAQRIMNR